MSAPQPTPSSGARRNSLLAASYVALTDVPDGAGPQVLSALERARIAAYLAERAAGESSLRLYVASGERADARTIVASVLRAGAFDALAGPADEPADPLAGLDADAAFAAIVAGWHVDTHAAIRAAEQDLNREDENWRLRQREQELARHKPDDGNDAFVWLDDDHYVPPNPPPIPRPTATMVAGLVLILASIVVLAFGDMLRLVFEVRLFLAVAGILTATGMFVMRLRSYRDDDDDGAVV